MKAAIPDSARSGGLMIFAPSGWGKSRLLGRRICYQDTLRGTGQVVIDRVGGTIDNLLDKVLYLPKDKQLEVGSRLIYCNMAGESGYVTLWPMLYRRYPEETLYQTSERVVKLLTQIDERFANATIQGLIRSGALLRPLCQVLVANDLSMSMLDPILADPKSHIPLIEEAQRRNPDSALSVGDLLEHAHLHPSKREERSEPLRNRFSVLKHDLPTRAMFATSRSPTVDWNTVTKDGLTVLIDLRHEVSESALILKLFWVWNSILEFIQSRGAAGHDLAPLSVVIDELSYFTHGTNLNIKEIIKDFREVVFARKRNANIWLTCATQEQRELPRELLTACLTLGSLMFGATVDRETALTLAERFDHLDTTRIKDAQAHYSRLPGYKDLWETTGTSKTFYTLQELGHTEAQKYLDIKKEDWFLAQAEGEGHVPRTLSRVTTRNLDPGQYVNERLVGDLKMRLMKRDGVKVAEVIQEIEEIEEMPPTPSSEREESGQKKASKPRQTGRRLFVEE